ncbi:chloride transporter [Actinotalea fermentans ATCC 43279 = JCM 9966 = DSM 3133]|nr:chloride transporter [Actinotalea fermentans ATCC 43279 = JCM 9966 = DSM 3133]
MECITLPDDAHRLAADFWVVVLEFAGRGRAWRFADVERAPGDALVDADPADWRGPAGPWRSSMSGEAYRAGVRAVHERIRAGDVYQVNLCRVLEADLAGGPEGEPDAAALGACLAAGNPAPFAGGIHVPRGGALPPVWLVSASPERFLSVADGRVASGPIKGTAATASGLTAKDAAENVMITDMVRNDLQRVCAPASVEVTALLAVEHHPGLVHLVSTVVGALLPDAGWPDLLAAAYPPASVSGAPKLAALDVIAELEPVPRGPYCGAFGWVDGAAGRAELAVAIRSFWWVPQDGGRLRFGTGAGITADSDPDLEWAETELKAARLVALAGGTAQTCEAGGGPVDAEGWRD